MVNKVGMEGSIEKGGKIRVIFEAKLFLSFRPFVAQTVLNLFLTCSFIIFQNFEVNIHNF